MFSDIPASRRSTRVALGAGRALRGLVPGALQFRPIASRYRAIASPFHPTAWRGLIRLLHAAACALLLCTVALPAAAAAQSRAPAARSVDDIVLDVLEEQHIPGAVLAIVHADSVLLLRAYGRTALEPDAPELAADAVFRASAATEVVGALAAMALAAEGRVDPARALGADVPGLPQELRGVTLAQLLSHTAGMSRVVAVPGRGGANDLGAAARQLTRFDRVTEPGLLYSASLTGRALAALVVERAAGRPYEDAVRRHVFAPLGMDASALSLPAVQPRLTQGWRSTFEPGDRVSPVTPLPDSAVHVPIRGLYSTVPDLARLAAALLSDGMVSGERVLPQGVAASIWHVHAPVPGSTVQAATGVRIGSWNERAAVTIAGGETGYALMMRLLPAERLGVIVLANNESANLTDIPDAVLAQLLRLPAAVQNAPSAPRAQPEDADVAMQRLLTHAGSYENGSELIEIVDADGTPMLRSDDLLLPVRALGDDRYGVLLDETRVGLVFRLIEDERGTTYLWLGNRALSPESVRRRASR